MKSLRPQGKRRQLETALSPKLNSTLRANNDCKECERAFRQATECVEDVSAVSKNHGHGTSGEFADCQAILVSSLLQRSGIRFKRCVEFLEHC